MSTASAERTESRGTVFRILGHIDFAAEVPSAGAHRLYLDFAHQGVVRTAEVTVLAGSSSGAPSSAPGATASRPAPTDTDRFTPSPGDATRITRKGSPR